MGQLADKLGNIRVRVCAPGVDLEAELRNYTEVTLSFGESVYDFISESALEQALGVLARLLHADWVRQYRSALDGTGVSVDPKDRHDRNFVDERSEIEASGSSSDQQVTLFTTGMNEFSARIKRGTVRELTERKFTSDVTEAASGLFEDFAAQAGDLHERYYD